MPLTPIAVKEYIGTITQSGTANPVVTIIKNTLGETPTWVRDALGQYSTTLTQPINNAKAYSPVFGNLHNNIILIPMSGGATGYYNLTIPGTNQIGLMTVSDLAWTPAELSTLTSGTDFTISINIQLYA